MSIEDKTILTIMWVIVFGISTVKTIILGFEDGFDSELLGVFFRLIIIVGVITIVCVGIPYMLFWR